MADAIKTYGLGTPLQTILTENPGLTARQLRDAANEAARQAGRVDGAIDPHTDSLRVELPVTLLRDYAPDAQIAGLPAPSTSNAAQDKGLARKQIEKARSKLVQLSRRDFDISTSIGDFKLDVLESPALPSQRAYLQKNPDAVFVSTRYTLRVDPQTLVDFNGAKLTANGDLMVEIQVPVELSDRSAIENFKRRITQAIQQGVPLRAEDAADDAKWPPGAVLTLHGVFRGGAAGSSGQLSANASREASATIRMEKTGAQAMELAFDLDRTKGRGVGASSSNLSGTVQDSETDGRGRTYRLDLSKPEHVSALASAVPWQNGMSNWLKGMRFSQLEVITGGEHRFRFGETLARSTSVSTTSGHIRAGGGTSRSDAERATVRLRDTLNGQLVTDAAARDMAERLAARDKDAIVSAPAGAQLAVTVTGDKAQHVVAGITSSTTVLNDYVGVEASLTATRTRTKNHMAHVQVRYGDDGKPVVELRTYDVKQLISSLVLDVSFKITPKLEQELQRYRRDSGAEERLKDMLTDHVSGGGEIATKIGDAAYDAVKDELNDLLERLRIRAEYRRGTRSTAELNFVSRPFDLADPAQRESFLAVVKDLDPSSAMRGGSFVEMRTASSRVKYNELALQAIIRVLVETKEWKDAKTLRVKLEDGTELQIDATDVGGKRSTKGPFEDTDFQVRLITIRDGKTARLLDNQLFVNTRTKDHQVFEHEKNILEAAVRHLGLEPSQHVVGEGGWFMRSIPFIGGAFPTAHGEGVHGFGFQINRDGLRQVMLTDPDAFARIMRSVATSTIGLESLPPSLTGSASPAKVSFEPGAIALLQRSVAADQYVNWTDAERKAADAELRREYEARFPGSSFDYAVIVYRKADHFARERSEAHRAVREAIAASPELSKLGLTEAHLEADLYRAALGSFLAEYVASQKTSDQEEKARLESYAQGMYHWLTEKAAGKERVIWTDAKIVELSERARAILDHPDMAAVRNILRLNPAAQIGPEVIQGFVEHVFMPLVRDGLGSSLSTQISEEEYAAALWLTVAAAAGVNNVHGKVSARTKDDELVIEAGVDGNYDGPNLDARMREAIIEVQKVQ